MKTCSHCQARNFDDLKVCALCGKELPVRFELSAYAAIHRESNPENASRGKTMAQETAYKHFLKAKVFIKQKNLLSAIHEFESALKSCPNDPMVRRLLEKTKEAHEKLQKRDSSAPSIQGLDPRTPVGPTKPLVEGVPPRPPRLQTRPAAPLLPTHEPPSPVASLAKPIASTARFFEAHGKAPSMSLALILDSQESEGLKELSVSLLIFLGLIIFAGLLFV